MSLKCFDELSFDWHLLVLLRRAPHSLGKISGNNFNSFMSLRTFPQVQGCTANYWAYRGFLICRPPTACSTLPIEQAKKKAREINSVHLYVSGGLCVVNYHRSREGKWGKKVSEKIISFSRKKKEIHISQGTLSAKYIICTIYIILFDSAFFN